MTLFYVCNHCGNLVEMVNASGVSMVCCGEPMRALVPNTVDAIVEKHLPAVTVTGDTLAVQVGNIVHPMEPTHWIEWIALETDAGIHRKSLHPGDAPHTSFTLGGDRPLAVYAFCNIHGLWKTSL